MHIYTALWGRTGDIEDETVLETEYDCSRETVEGWIRDLEQKIEYTGIKLELWFRGENRVTVLCSSDPEDVLDEMRVSNFDLTSYIKRTKRIERPH